MCKMLREYWATPVLEAGSARAPCTSKKHFQKVVKTFSAPGTCTVHPSGTNNHKGSWFMVGATCPADRTLRSPAIWPVALTKDFVQRFVPHHVVCGVDRPMIGTICHHRSTGSVHWTVPPLSRLVHQFGRNLPKCLDTQTHRQTDKHVPVNFFFHWPTKGNFQMQKHA